MNKTYRILQNLSILLKADVPLLEALKALEKDCSDKSLCKMLIKAHSTISEGSSLSKVLAKYPKRFPKTVIVLCQSGEIHNTLAERLVDMIYVFNHLELLQKKKTEPIAKDFFNIFANLISSNVPIIRALEVLEDDYKNYDFKEIIKTIKKQIQKGIPLHKTLEQFPDTFSVTQITLIQAAEINGNWIEILQYIQRLVEL